MKVIILVLFILISKFTFSQKFQDIVEYNNEFYLMTPSPSASIFFDTLSEMEFNQWMDFSASYEIRNDSLFFKEFIKLKPNNPYFEILNNNLKSGDYVNVCLKFNLIKITEFKEQFEKQIRYSPVFLKSYRDNPTTVRVRCNYNKLFIEEDTTLNREIVWGEFTLEQCFNDFLEFNSIHITDSNNQTVIKETFYSSFNKKTYQLKEGKYSVELTSRNSTLIIQKMVIHHDSKETLKCSDNYYRSNYQNNNQNDVEVKYAEIKNNNLKYEADRIDINYGNNTFYQNSPVEINYFGLGYSYQLFSSFGPRRMIDGLLDVGGNYNIAIHNTGTINRNNTLIRLQNYSHLNFKLGTGIRFNLSSIKNAYPQRPFIELGAGYHLPLLFRHLYRSTISKFSDRWIHNFQDVYVYSRIGISNSISIQSSYRIFDVVLKNKPQLPTWQFSFIIEMPY